MVSNTCIIFYYFFLSRQNSPAFFSRRFVFILNKPPFALGRCHFLLLRWWRPPNRWEGRGRCVTWPYLARRFPPAFPRRLVIAFLFFGFFFPPLFLFVCASTRADAPNATEHKQANPVNSHLHFRTITTTTTTPAIPRPSFFSVADSGLI